MKANEIFKKLIDGAYEKREVTCDGLVAGNPNKEIYRAATCFKLTSELIEMASEQGIDLVITHEPTFSCGDKRDDAVGFDIKKWELLDKSGIILYRFHDHAHNTEPDYIHEGFIRSLGLDIASRIDKIYLGVARYELKESISVKELSDKIKKHLGIEFVRVVGSTEQPIKTIGLGLGGVGFNQIKILYDPGCDTFITGECNEVLTEEYVRDACYFGAQKSLFLLGHFGSEYAGMRYLAERMNDTLVPTVFLNGGEVYRGVD